MPRREFDMRVVLAHLLIGTVALLPISSNADTTTPPTIITGGPYTDTLGQPLQINAMLINNEDNGAYPFSYSVRINNGLFGGNIAPGAALDINLFVSWSTLVSDGISTTSGGTYDIHFLAGDNYGNLSQADTNLAVSAPEIDPTSAVSVITLLLGGLMVLRGRRDQVLLPVAI